MIDTSFSVAQLNQGNKGNMSEALGIEFVAIEQNKLMAKMPVDHRTIQPIGILNGGASAALAETVGSLASYLSVDRNRFYTVGQEIKCNHVRSAASGFVFATAMAEHLGKRTQVWSIRITNEQDKLVCLAILTVQVMEIADNPMAKSMLVNSPLAKFIQ
ncbi:MAG: hotdog fold thioesterase [Bacteroidia bacterium]